MKAQSLSGRELANRVGRLLGRPYNEQNVSRRLTPSSTRPLFTISEDLRTYCAVLQLDPADVIAEAIRNEDRCPTCGSPDRAVRWKLDPEAYGIITCNREFHDNAVCAQGTDNGPCARPIEYVTEGSDETSGWYHTDRDVTDHHALPGSLTR
jgi:hypothetical protein